MMLFFMREPHGSPLMTQPQVMSLVLRVPCGTRLLSRVKRVQLVLRESRESKEPRDQRVTLETRVLLVPPVLRELLGLLAHRDHREKLAQRGHREILD
jgi:hypothetical protein